ncbi:hypothetical protein Glove_33g182 [Diversispora epigaea]|uniref:Uncharacterized protein n=1 Tax=Diversispora epigaea TaxID=1348612 RepID=A0A397JJZ4_9GLOM|nr:hypothetical protein Glove_33g182 [Diversispora epigaea]
MHASLKPLIWTKSDPRDKNQGPTDFYFYKNFFNRDFRLPTVRYWTPLHLLADVSRLPKDQSVNVFLPENIFPSRRTSEKIFVYLKFMPIKITTTVTTNAEYIMQQQIQKSNTTTINNNMNLSPQGQAKTSQQLIANNKLFNNSCSASYSTETTKYNQENNNFCVNCATQHGQAEMSRK